MKRIGLWIVMVCAALLTACAGPQKINMPPNTLARGQSITVVEVPPVKTYFVYAPHIGMAFGAIGGAIAGADMQTRAGKIGAIMQSQKVEVDQIMTRGIVRDLEAAGYQVKVMHGAWTEKDGGHVIDLEKLDPSLERVLVVTPRIVGFAADGMTENYQPTVWVVASLMGRDRKTPLYQGFHSTGWKPKLGEWSYIEPRTAGVPNFEGLLNKPVDTARLLEQAAETVAKSVSSDLVKP
ncbi:MAG: hypothetical protein KF686_09445 [Ramlibacter sp.]|nr:hypothetical protein [Ramlibacter sp.]